jgi:HSP20 family protein
MSAMSTIVNPLNWLGPVRPGASGIRIEDRTEDHRYIVRAEVPGVDPTRDVHLTSTGQALRLEVTRTGSRQDTERSEFHYGTFVRTIALPEGAVEATIAATYDRGVVEISMSLAEGSPPGRPIPVLPVEQLATARAITPATGPTRQGTSGPPRGRKATARPRTGSH